MKKILLLIAASVPALQLTSYGQIIYSEDFTSAPTFVAGAGTNNADVVLVAPGETNTGSIPQAVFGNFFGGGDQLTIDVGSGALGISGAASASRSRGVSFAVDTSSATAGLYSLSFDVSSFLNENAIDGDTLSYNLYEGSGLLGDGDTNYLLVDHGRNGTGAAPQNVTAFGSVTEAQIGSTSFITGDGNVSLDFTLTEAGVAGDFLLVNFTSFSSASETVSIALPGANIDNITIGVAVPEPTSFALISLGLMGLVLLRRVRR